MTRDTRLNLGASIALILLMGTFLIAPLSCAPVPPVAREFVPVPEPAGYGAVGVGMIAVVVLLKRK